MGTYIKGMKTPKDCNSCFLDIYDRQTYCHNGDKTLCPLIEVKTPHGKLIDVEEMIQNHYIYYGRNFMMFGEMNKAPTVIEAEGE